MQHMLARHAAVKPFMGPCWSPLWTSYLLRQSSGNRCHPGPRAAILTCRAAVLQHFAFDTRFISEQW